MKCLEVRGRARSTAGSRREAESSEDSLVQVVHPFQNLRRKVASSVSQGRQRKGRERRQGRREGEQRDAPLTSIEPETAM